MAQEGFRFSIVAPAQIGGPLFRGWTNTIKDSACPKDLACTIKILVYLCNGLIYAYNSENCACKCGCTYFALAPRLLTHFFKIGLYFHIILKGIGLFVGIWGPESHTLTHFE